MKHLCIVGALALLLCSGCTSTMTTISRTTCDGLPVIQISGAIDSKGARTVSREIRAASEQSPRAIIVEIDTPGGMLSACESLADALSEVSLPVYALVGDGVAGGAMVALAADHIFLKPGGCIGAAAVVLPLNGDIDEELVSKFTADIEAKMASIASRNGHNPEIAKCMVNRQRALTLQGRTISRKGSMLCLTAEEAIAVGLSEGTLETVQELADRILQNSG